MVTSSNYTRLSTCDDSATTTSSLYVNDNRYNVGKYYNNALTDSRSRADIDSEILRRENVKLKDELTRVKRLNDKLTKQNNKLYSTIAILKTQLSILYDAVAIHTCIDKVKDTVKKITTARKNKYEFDKLLGYEANYLNEL